MVPFIGTSFLNTMNNINHSRSSLSHNTIIIVHRLIQAVLKDELSGLEVEQYCGEVVELCSAAFPKDWNANESRELGRMFQNQVLEPVFEAAKIPSGRAASTLRQIGGFLSD